MRFLDSVKQYFSNVGQFGTEFIGSLSSDNLHNKMKRKFLDKRKRLFKLNDEIN